MTTTNQNQILQFSKKIQYYSYSYDYFLTKRFVQVNNKHCNLKKRNLANEMSTLAITN